MKLNIVLFSNRQNKWKCVLYIVIEIDQYRHYNFVNKMVSFYDHTNISLNIRCLNFLEIYISWVYYTIRFGRSLFWNFLEHHFSSNFVWLRITDEGSVVVNTVNQI